MAEKLSPKWWSKEAVGPDVDRRRRELAKKEKALRQYDKKHGTDTLGEFQREEARKFDEWQKSAY